MSNSATCKGGCVWQYGVVAARVGGAKPTEHKLSPYGERHNIF